MGDMNLSNGALFMLGKDGTYEKLTEITNIKEFDDGSTENGLDTNTYILPHLYDYEGSFVLTNKFSKMIKNLFIFGWRANGPVRKKLLQDAVSRRMRHYVYQGSAI